MSGSLTIVIPCYNEELSLPATIPPLLEFAAKSGYKVIVVNDGSGDRSKAILEGLIHSGANQQLIHHKVNKGYGGALKTGIAAADTEFVITIDADGQHQLPDVTALLEHIRSTDADMVIGCRGSSGSSFFRNTGKWIIRKVAAVLIPNNISDLNSGMKIYRRNYAQKYLPLCPDSMAFSDVIALVFINQKHLVKELNIHVSDRVAGKSTIGINTAFETLSEILNIVMLFNPMRLFVPLALFLTCISLLWGLPILIKGKGLSVGALLGFVLGFLCFIIGLLAEQLSQIRKQTYIK